MQLAWDFQRDLMCCAISNPGLAPQAPRIKLGARRSRCPKRRFANLRGYLRYLWKALEAPGRAKIEHHGGTEDRGLRIIVTAMTGGGAAGCASGCESSGNWRGWAGGEPRGSVVVPRHAMRLLCRRRAPRLIDSKYRIWSVDGGARSLCEYPTMVVEPRHGLLIVCSCRGEDSCHFSGKNVADRDCCHPGWFS